MKWNKITRVTFVCPMRESILFPLVAYTVNKKLSTYLLVLGLLFIFSSSSSSSSSFLFAQVVSQYTGDSTIPGFQENWRYTYQAQIIILETKASSHEGQCIPAGCRVTLPIRVFITMSIITMRSRLFPANSASDCLRFRKCRPQFCEFCGAIYRPICETFSALQITSGSVTDVENRFQIDA